MMPKTYNELPRIVNISILVWGATVFFYGTNFRYDRVVYETGVDWLIIVRLLISFLGFILGITLINRNSNRIKIPSIIIMYIVVAGLSVFVSQGHKIVLGYWIPLLGSMILTVGLVQSDTDMKIINKMEKLWLIIVAIIILKDTITSYIMIKSDTEIDLSINQERLGVTISSPAILGLYAAIAFWISFGEQFKKNRVFMWISRLFFIYVMISTRTRIVLISFIIAGLLRLGFSQGKPIVARWILIIACSLTVLGAGLLSDEIGLNKFSDTVNWINRGQQTETIETLAGRTDIWTSAIKKVFNQTSTAILGFGYGTSRFYLNWSVDSPKFYASHCHNAYIEHLFGLGLLGLIVFICLVIINMRWLTRYTMLKNTVSKDFSDHAISTVVILFISFLTESTMGGRINSLNILYLFYLMCQYRIPAQNSNSICERGFIEVNKWENKIIY
jgi:O-antigen ligase